MGYFPGSKCLVMKKPFNFITWKHAPIVQCGMQDQDACWMMSSDMAQFPWGRNPANPSDMVGLWCQLLDHLPECSKAVSILPMTTQEQNLKTYMELPTFPYWFQPTINCWLGTWGFSKFVCNNPPFIAKSIWTPNQPFHTIHPEKWGGWKSL